MLIKRLFHRTLARLAARWPALSNRLTAAFRPMVSTSVPWTPVIKPLAGSIIALVTTAGVHHKGQTPFDMNDSHGDPSFRIIDGMTIAGDYKITHDYYDHWDADRDLNIVFPIARLQEMAAAGLIGAVSPRHFSFMGHIHGPHLRTLTDRSAPRVAGMLRDLRVDAVLLTPA